MVFSSPPLYIDPPNWHHQFVTSDQVHDQNTFNFMHHTPLSTPNSSFVRPSSMADRARLAKIPQPESPINCPRCDSTNTKFCYFNNYSLTQPRHFCKTCRRYWTQGGALRNVPVGGGCRRNKRGKSTTNRSRSPPSVFLSETQAITVPATSTTAIAGVSGAHLTPFQIPMLQEKVSFSMVRPTFSGTNFGSGAAVILDDRYSFMSDHNSAAIPPTGSVKMEGEKNTNLNEMFVLDSSSTRNFVGGNMNEQYGWLGGNPWISSSELSGFASSSSNTHLL